MVREGNTGDRRLYWWQGVVVVTEGNTGDKR